MTDRELFLAALDRNDPSARARYLVEHCPEPEVRARVERLLAAFGEAGNFLEQPADPGPTITHDPGPMPTAEYTPGGEAGAVIAGRYTLVERIGTGGMGEVWVARQTEPVSRKVALKLIKAGMDSKQVMARFEAERQALAMMDHPNIAKVLDGGLHEQRPFFVMELVKGVPITDYCDARKLTPRERLELFVPVCQAIQHAHQKGIIHRDIKPSNVLIALYDDKPVVKVIDFGVAKATGGTLTEATIDTGFGGVVGTPQYMSPEQATFNNLDIDTRSDVYSLGVLLYELLAGSPPFSRKELERKGLLEILRVVREEEPPRPSNKLSTADALPTLSANRGTDPKSLTGLLRNELDWVVMKALEKDRSRRYETANGFAADVLRYLSGEAVQAHPPSAVYRLKKFVRRHRGQVIAASLVLAVLVAGMIGTSVGLLQAEARRQDSDQARADEATQRQAAEKAADAERLAKRDAESQKQQALTAAEEERKAKGEADAKRKEAETNLAFARKGNEILGSVFRGLDPRRRYATAAELRNALRDNLNKAVRELDGSAIGDPLEVAGMQHTLGLSLLALGEANAAIVVLQKANETLKARLGADHHHTLVSTANLAHGYRLAGLVGKALPLLEKTLPRLKDTLGPGHSDVLAAMDNLAGCYRDAGQLDKAVPLFAETFRRMKDKHGPDHSDTLTAMVGLAVAYVDAGEPHKALPLLTDALKRRQDALGANHYQTLATSHNLAECYRHAGLLAKALPLHKETLQRMKDALGVDHPDAIRSMAGLASCYQNAGDPDKALPLLEEALKLSRFRQGPDHPDTLTCMNNLAGGYRLARLLDKALPLLVETLRLTKEKSGANHPDTLSSMNNLGDAYGEARQFDKAIPLLQETLRLRKAILGLKHFETHATMNNLGLAYLGTGEMDKALPLLEETLDLRKASRLGLDHPNTIRSMNNLGMAYHAAGQFDKALPLVAEALRRREATLGPDHPGTIDYKGNLGKVYVAAGQGGKAAVVLGEFVAGVRKRHPTDDPQFAMLLAQVALELLQCGQHAAAEEMLRECVAIREKRAPDAWSTFNAQSMLGEALVGQKKYADAEPLLLAGYEGMKKREKTIPPPAATRIPEALDRLIDLYTATDRPDEAMKWRAERAKYPFVAPAPRAVR
jgi:tetratricopeptide (TPR) repeat protein